MSGDSINEDTILLSLENDEVSRETCFKFALGIMKKKITFLELVEFTEPYLTNPDLKKHDKGLDFLAQILQLLPRDFFIATELDLISKFFCAQLKLHHSFTSAALKGLMTLVQNVHLSKESLHSISSTLFNNVVWQTQRLSDRRTLYSILHYIVFNRLEDFQSVSSELLFSVISAVDGERDPRNLLSLFSFLPRLYSSIPLGPLCEDAFEVVSCYFPIDFNSSGSEGGSVCREDLVSALQPCLLAVPQFAEFCIPLIQEKLESSLKPAKIDSYNLLMEGCKVWPTKYIVPYAEQLWLTIKQDTLPPRDTNIAETATQALHALVHAVPEENLSPLLHNVIYSCERFLSDVQLSMFEPSSRLLLAAMQASKFASQIVSLKILPGLISLLKVSQESDKTLVLSKLSAFTQVYLNNNQQFDSGGDLWTELFRELQLCTEQGSAAVQQAAYLTLSVAAAHLNLNCRTRLYCSILTHLTTPQLPTHLRSACLKSLHALAVIHEDEVHEKIVRHLFFSQGSEDELALKENKFEALCMLSVIERFQQTLKQQFNILMSQGSCESMVINCLRNFVEQKEVQDNKTLLYFLFSESDVLSTLINLNKDGEDLINAAKIIQILVQHQTSNDQARTVCPFVKDLLHRPNGNQQMVLLESLVGSLWPNVSVLAPEEILQVIIPAALCSENSLCQKSALQLLSSIINKSSDDILLELVSHHLQLSSPLVAANAHAYVTKALVICGHSSMESWVNKLIDSLDSDEVGHIAADGIKLIVMESQFLSHQNHCFIRLLYRQRLFHLVVPKLVSSVRKIQHLKALIYLLQAVPHTVYVHHIKQIMPLLVKSMDMDDEKLLLTVLHTLANLLSINHSFLEDQVDTFIPRFLHLSIHSTFMHVRIASLQCLSSSLKCSPILMLPHKQQVVAQLVHCLDDKKRLVRKEAGRTRSKWFLLGTPTADP